MSPDELYELQNGFDGVDCDNDDDGPYEYDDGDVDHMSWDHPYGDEQ